MGGMRALEWAVSRPEQVARLFFLASGVISLAAILFLPLIARARPRADDRP